MIGVMEMLSMTVHFCSFSIGRMQSLFPRKPGIEDVFQLLDYTNYKKCIKMKKKTLSVFRTTSMWYVHKIIQTKTHKYLYPILFYVKFL